MRATAWLHAVLLATSCVVAAGIRPASACTCSGQPPCQAYASSTVAFVGDVLSSDDMGGSYRMRMRVVRALKGVSEATTIDVWSDEMCGVRLEKGARYAIFAARPSYGFGRIMIPPCGYVVRIIPGEAEPDVPPVPGRIYGRVFRINEHPGGSIKPWEPVPSIRVTLDLPAGPVTTATDRSGRYHFGPVPPGQYRLSVGAGQGLTPMLQQVTLPDRPACIATRFDLRPTP